MRLANQRSFACRKLSVTSISSRSSVKARFQPESNVVSATQKWMSLWRPRAQEFEGQRAFDDLVAENFILHVSHV
jgi:hypothetical protein